MLHKNAIVGDRHAAHNWEYANEAARLAATGFVAGDVHTLALQLDDGTVWRLTATTPTWEVFGAPTYAALPDIPAAIWEVPPMGITGAVLQKLDVGWHWTMVLDGGDVLGVVTGLPGTGYVPAPTPPLGPTDFLFDGAPYTPDATFVFIA